MVPIVDTHQHLLFPGRLPYPWVEDIPALRGRAFGREEYAAAAEGCGVTATVFMEATEVDPAEHDEAELVESLPADPAPPLIGIVAACRPESPAFPSCLESLRGTRAVGVRRILHTQPDELTRRPVFRESLRLLPEHGLTFDLCVLARQLPVATELVDACPGVSFVLDHCGVPSIAAGELEPWRTHVTELAARPNVVCKVSGLLAYCDPENATLDAVRPYAEHAIAAFGWERVLWGSDWPVVEITSTLGDWVRISRALVAGQPETRLRALFRENAVRVYGLAGRAG
jgi:predicted TIM-barrel fold metal-dependent hydrolase